jgi:hypothetical protein
MLFSCRRLSRASRPTVRLRAALNGILLQLTNQIVTQNLREQRYGCATTINAGELMNLRGAPLHRALVPTVIRR